MILIKLYDEIDIKNLQFLGRGTQGSVYKIDNTKCIKIFRNNINMTILKSKKLLYKYS